MAKFRLVYTNFWNDTKVEEELTPEEKYFFLYLLTNPHTTQTGIYQITRKKMEFDLGYSLETVDALLKRFIHNFKMIRYNTETRELAIKNWGRYNLKRGGKPMLDCIHAELKRVMDKELITYVGERVEHADIKALYDSFTDSKIIHTEKLEKTDAEDKQCQVRDLFNHYISKNIILHKKMTPAMQRVIKARLRDYTYDELKTAIDNYAYVYFSDNHWFTHKYPLADFMRDKDVRKFLDEADPIHNFSNKEPIYFSHPREVRKEYFDLS